MAEEKRDSFWDNNNDDFWNKPVVSEDWLKSDSDSFWSKEEPRIKEAEEDTADKPADKPDIPCNNIQNRVQDLYEADVNFNSAYAEVLQLHEKKSEPKKKNVYVRIWLSAIGITTLIIILFVLAAKWHTYSAMKAASKFHGVECLADNKIILSKNEVMLLEDFAYTVVPELEDEFSQEDEKVVAVYAILGSERFEKKLNAIRPYISYETQTGTVYKAMCNSWKASEYGLEEYGFTEEHFLYSYTGKGYDSAGFYFFVVPKDLKEVKFYVETYSDNKHCRIVENIYVKELKIIDDFELELLHLNRKVVQ